MITGNLRSGDGVSSGSTSTIPCVIDTCSGGIVGQWYAFNPGDVVTDQLGGGRGADAVLALLAWTTSPVYFTPATPTWGTVPSVVHVGTGPTVTCALTAAAAGQGPFDDHTIVATVEQGGANGTAILSLAYDGVTKIEALPVPVEQGGTIVGTAAITPATLALANALTLQFDQPAAKTLTLASPSLAAAPAGLKAATATSASPVTLHASDLLSAGVTVTRLNVRAITFTTAGSTASDAPASVTVTGLDYTGATISETLNLSQTAGAVTTVKAYDLTTCTIAYLAADGTGATIAIGYAAAFASVAELIAEINALAVAAPLLVTAFDSQSNSGHFLGLVTQALGTAAQIELDPSTTSLTLFGLTASVITTGLAATFAPPWTGEVLAFPSGVYVAKDTYTIANAGPSASITAITAAMAVGRSKFRDHPFGYFAITAPPSSAANAAALQAAVTSTLNPWRTDCSCPVWAMLPTQFHAASAVPATSASNILAADNALSAAFSSSAAALDMVCPDDCYVGGSSNLRTGSFRRSAVLAAAIKRASLPKLGSDIAEGIVPGVSLKGPDGATLARDEFYATVKLGPAAGGSSGPGFAVLESTMAGPGSPKFSAGTTRAGSTSRYRFSYVVVVALEMLQSLFARAKQWQGETWPTNPATGSILDSEADHRAKDCVTDLQPLLTPEGKDPSVSTFDVVIDNSGKFVDSGDVPLNGSFVTLGLVLDVSITVTARGTAAASLTP